MLHAAMLRHVRNRKWRDKPAATSATIAFPSAKALKLRTVLFSGGMESWFVIERKSHHPLPAFAEGQPARVMALWLKLGSNSRFVSHHPTLRP